jgi:hypothetical protein
MPRHNELANLGQQSLGFRVISRGGARAQPLNLAQLPSHPLRLSRGELGAIERENPRLPCFVRPQRIDQAYTLPVLLVRGPVAGTTGKRRAGEQTDCRRTNYNSR